MKNYSLSKSGQLKATLQYTGYKRRATKYLYSGSGKDSMQPITFLQFDGEPTTRSVDVTVTVPRTPVHIYLTKTEENTNVKLSAGFSLMYMKGIRTTNRMGQRELVH